MSPLQPVPGFGNDIARVDLDFRPELFHGHDVEVNRPGADGAAAGQRDLGFTAARQKGPEHPETGPHFGNQVIRGCGVHNALGRNFQGFTGRGALPRALARNRNVNPVILQDPLQAERIHQARNIAQRQCFGGEQRRDHQGQSSVFGARDIDGAVQFVAAANTDTIHSTRSLQKNQQSRPRRPPKRR